MFQLRASSIFVLLSLTLVLAGACGQEPPRGNGGGGGETAGGGATGGGTTEGTAGETTAAETFQAEEGKLVIYSGREDGLVGPGIEQCEAEAGMRTPGR